MTNRCRQFSQESKPKIITMAINHKRKIAKVADSLGIRYSMSGNCLCQSRKEQQGIQRLRKRESEFKDGARYLKKGFNSTGIRQPKGLSVITKLAEQVKLLSKWHLSRFFSKVISSYYTGLKISPLISTLCRLRSKSAKHLTYQMAQQAPGLFQLYS